MNEENNERTDNIKEMEPRISSKKEDFETSLKIMKIKIKKGLYRVFVRDLNIDVSQSVKLLFHGLIVGTLLTFMIYNTVEGTPNLAYSSGLKITIFIITGLTILFGGIITDFLIRFKYLYEILTFISAIPIVIMLSSLNPIIIIFATFILGITSSLLLILFITGILFNTDLLNRARILTLIIFGMGIFSTPIIVLIFFIQSQTWVWIVILILGIISIIYSYKISISPLEIEIVLLKVEKISFRNYVKTIWKSGGVPYIFFMFFTSFILGFFLSSLVNISFNVISIIVVIFVGIISFPLIAALIDNIGRKPAAYIVLFLIGTFCVFFDYPSTNLVNLNIFLLAVFAFSTLLILILTTVVAGDLSSAITRGKITGVFMFTTVLGVILGSMLRVNLFTIGDFTNPDMIKEVADWSSFLILITALIFAFTKEPFEEHSTTWREYVNRVYIISDNGLSIYSRDFGKTDEDRKEVDEDLVSGGLTGLQAILNEISQSEERIKVMDHGDFQILFHYGRYSMAVLFTQKDLKVLVEKLANFHNSFELMNEKKLKKFTGEVTGLYGIDDLAKKYFL